MPFLRNGAIAQLGERLPCTQEVSGSIPLGSTIFLSAALASSSHTTVCFLLAALHKAKWLRLDIQTFIYRSKTQG